LTQRCIPVELPNMSLHVILGPMFAGKSSALQSTIRRHEALGWNVFVITHSVDTRYVGTPQIVSHDRQAIPAYSCKNLLPMLDEEKYKESRLVVVEEGQFFPDLVEFVRIVTDKHRKPCVVVGLDGDKDRRPFGQMLELVPLADKVEKLTALCKRCGDGTEAIFTACLRPTEELVCVGAAELYVPLCRRHYLDNGEPKPVSTMNTLYGC